MKIETLNGMMLFTDNKDAFTGITLKGLKNTPIYIETGGNDYERFWINEQTFYTIIDIFNAFETRHTEIYLSFEDVQNVKVNLGLKPDNQCIDKEMEDLFEYPFRDSCYDNTEIFNSESNTLYDKEIVSNLKKKGFFN